MMVSEGVRNIVSVVWCVGVDVFVVCVGLIVGVMVRMCMGMCVWEWGGCYLFVGCFASARGFAKNVLKKWIMCCVF